MNFNAELPALSRFWSRWFALLWLRLCDLIKDLEAILPLLLHDLLSNLQSKLDLDVIFEQHGLLNLIRCLVLIAV